MYLQQEGHLRSLAEEIALLATVKQQLEDAITFSVAKGLHFAVSNTTGGDTLNGNSKGSTGISSSSVGGGGGGGSSSTAASTLVPT